MKTNQHNSILLSTVFLFFCFSPLLAQVTIYQHCNYGGWSIQLDTGTFNSTAIREAGGLPDDASSIKVPFGYTVTVFSGDNFTGNSVIYTADDTCFVNEGFNDVISSIKVETQDAATLYQHCGYRGWEAKFGVGNFNSNAIRAAGGLPDDASSLEITPGYQMTLYTGDNFTGNSILYTNADDCIWNEGFNDVVSSLKVERQNTNGDWDNFPYPIVNIVDEASYHNGSRIFWDALPNAEQIIKQLILEVCKKIYYNDSDNLLTFNKLNLYLRDEGGVAAKWGSPPEISIKISVRHIQNVYNNEGGNLQAVKEEIEGILSHECTHAYQWSPKNAGPYQGGTEFYGFIEGLADYVRISLGRHPGRSPQRGGSWTSGYTTSGFFINWMVDTKDPEFAIKFNHTARTYGTWSWDSACRNILGESVQSLWNQYQNSLPNRMAKSGDALAKESQYDAHLDCNMKVTKDPVSDHETLQSNWYPNPISSQVNISITGKLHNKTSTIELHNISGTVVKKGAIKGNQGVLDMSNLPSGIYLAIIKNENTRIQKRIIKQ